MQPIYTDKAPNAIGVYSQAIRVGNVVYLSGQIGLEPQSMTIVLGGIKAEIKQVLENIKAVCQASGGSLADLVKATIYLTDLNHFSLVNDAMSHYFKEPYPARAVIEVSGLPRGGLIEMDGIMVLPQVLAEGDDPC